MDQKHAVEDVLLGAGLPGLMLEVGRSRGGAAWHALLHGMRCCMRGVAGRLRRSAEGVLLHA